MSRRRRWAVEGRDWPNRAAQPLRRGGRRALARPGRRAAGRSILLLHGTGAATHSWRDLAPLLAERFTVVAPDLPGHGFTSALGVADDAGDGARGRGAAGALGLPPALIVGHSAGAAIALRMALDSACPVDRVQRRAAAVSRPRRDGCSRRLPSCCSSIRSCRRSRRCRRARPASSSASSCAHRLADRCARGRSVRAAVPAARACRRRDGDDGGLGPRAARRRPAGPQRRRCCSFTPTAMPPMPPSVAREVAEQMPGAATTHARRSAISRMRRTRRRGGTDPNFAKDQR